MKKTVSRYEFKSEFEAIRPDNFSNEGLNALFDYLEDLEESLCEEFELDVIAFCCEYSEYESIEDFQDNYGDDYETIEDIEEATTVIMINDESFIIQDF